MSEFVGHDGHDDSGDEVSAPVWTVFGDLMAGLLGAFVLVLVGVLLTQRHPGSLAGSVFALVGRLFGVSATFPVAPLIAPTTVLAADVEFTVKDARFETLPPMLALPLPELRVSA